MGRRNDSGWRREVLARRGSWCRSCGVGGAHVLQIDHLVPRSQGGQSVVENGLVLCGPFAGDLKFAGGCHQAKTDSRMTIEYDWLDEDQIAWLAEVGWVVWDQTGSPTGRGWRHFTERRIKR